MANNEWDKEDGRLAPVHLVHTFYDKGAFKNKEGDFYYKN